MLLSLVFIIVIIVIIYAFMSFESKTQVQRERCIYTITYTPCTAICGGGSRIKKTVLSADSSQTCAPFDDETFECNLEPCPVSDDADDIDSYITNGGNSNSCFLYPYWRTNWDIDRARSDQSYLNVYKRIKSVCSTKDSRSACISTGRLPIFSGDSTRPMCSWLY